MTRRTSRSNGKRKEEKTMVADTEKKKRETKYLVNPETGELVLNPKTGKPIRAKDDNTPWAAPTRKPENVLIRRATDILVNTYHVPEDKIKVRRHPLYDERTIYLVVNDEQEYIRNEKDLHRVLYKLATLQHNGQ